MELEHARTRIEELTEMIEQHNYNYYVLNAPTISDYEFDKLMAELIKLEKQFPQLASPYSPTQRVGGEITKEFQTVRHRTPMLSLSNTYTDTEIRDFDQRVRKTIGNEVEYVCELKFDGVAISLIYEDGKLIRGVTRGDGTQGDDVTANVKTIRSIPLRLKGDFPSQLEMRGEIYMTHAEFNRLNQEREEIGEIPFVNPRNAAAGSLKLQDSTEVAHRHPLPQGLGIDAADRHGSEEIDADPQGGEGRQPYAANPDQGRGALAEAADGEGQHQPSQQRK